MRVAIVSDIHGNLTVFEAVLADLRHQSPDAVYHLGDLATHGFRPAEVVDRIRQLGWKGVVGNTDEMLWRPELLDELVARSPKLEALLRTLFHDLAPATRALLGPDRLAWLQDLPATLRDGGLAILHAGHGNLWRAPMPDSSDEALDAAYGSLHADLVVYGHIHRPFVRAVGKFLVANTGSVGLSYDGDPRASYLLVDEGRCQIQRVEYDVEQEIRGLLSSGYPRAEWLAAMLRTARYAAPR